MYTALPTFAKGVIPVFEVMVGLDKIHIDDSINQLVSEKRYKEFINVKNLRNISDK